MGFLKEFKEFAVKGNVIDLAVGVIIGGAFGKIVASVVNDVIMPPVGVLLGGVDFKDLKVILKEGSAAVLENGKEIAPAVADVTLNYGMFIQTVVDFTIVAFCVFLLVKGINKLKKKPEEVAAPDPEPTTEEKLLTEIRDLLKNK
jgi:large conductance mechanosensitive channel